MATPTPVKMAQAELGVLATLYTVPVATTTIMRSFDVCNTTTNALTFRLYLVPNGDSAGVDNALRYDRSVPGKGDYGWEGEQVLSAGDTVQASGSAGLTITMSGVQLA